jgi:Spy/CpxP family protein refolding chaperone
MSETENTSNSCLKCRTNWAFALSIISLALNVILITALITAICGHHRHFGHKGGFGQGKECGAPEMKCPQMGGPGGHEGHFGQFQGPRANFGGWGDRQGWKQGHGGFGGEHRGERMLAHMSMALNLDEGQQAKIKQIFEDQRAQITKLDQPSRDDIKKIMEDGKTKIRAVLKTDQQKKFDEMVAKFKAMHEQRS